jgi:hypothetical protein
MISDLIENNNNNNLNNKIEEMQEKYINSEI